jgi:hypothetical protein
LGNAPSIPEPSPSPRKSSAFWLSYAAVCICTFLSALDIASQPISLAITTNEFCPRLQSPLRCHLSLTPCPERPTPHGWEVVIRSRLQPWYRLLGIWPTSLAGVPSCWDPSFCLPLVARWPGALNRWNG